MPIENINTIPNCAKTNNQANTPPRESEKVTDKVKSKEESNGKALLLGSLTALAVGAGIYIITKGKKTPSTPPSSKTNSQADKLKEELNQIINPELIKNEDLRSIITKLNNEVEMIGSGSFSVYLRKLESELYKESLKKSVKCETPEELYKLLNKVYTNNYEIPVDALTCHKVFNLEKNIKNYNKYVESENKIGLGKKRKKIVTTDNATPQEKMKLLIDNSIELFKNRLNATIGFHYKDLETSINDKDIELSKELYNSLMKILKSRLEYIS